MRKKRDSSRVPSTIASSESGSDNIRVNDPIRVPASDLDSGQLDGTNEFEPLREAWDGVLKDRLFKWIPRLAVRFAVIVRDYGPRSKQRFCAAYRVFYENDRKLSVAIGKNLVRSGLFDSFLKDSAKNIIGIWPTKKGRDEGINLVPELEYRIRNAGAVRVDWRDLETNERSTFLIVLLNSGEALADTTTGESTRIRWERETLDALYRDMVVHPREVGYQTFLKQSADLLHAYAGKWFVFHLTDRLGPFETKQEAVAASVHERGWPSKEIYVRIIEEESISSTGIFC